MANSLIDQLKKTGLVDKSKVQKVKHGQYKSKKQKTKKGEAAQLDEAKVLAQQAQASKVERDRRMNQQQKDEAEAKAVAAQIIQMIESSRVEERDGEIVYNFTDANVVKRMHVSEEIHKHLMSGGLAIVKFGGGYELVPRVVAEKIKERDAACVIDLAHELEPEEHEDDAYAAYKIPDDLVW